MNEDIRRAILAVKILSELPQAELKELLPCFSLVKAKVGDFIIRENALDTDIFFIAEGQAKICHADSDGKEVILALVRSGEVIGEMAALNQSSRTSDVIATFPCVLIKISAQNILKHLEYWPGLSLQLLKSMSHKLFCASVRIRELALHDVTTRTVQILLSISELAEYEDSMLPIVNPRPTHQSLASMVGTSREVISRTLKVLEEAGQILFEEDRLILVRNRDASSNSR